LSQFLQYQHNQRRCWVWWSQNMPRTLSLIDLCLPRQTSASMWLSFCLLMSWPALASPKPFMIWRCTFQTLPASCQT
jgi:hypothetical protein